MPFFTPQYAQIIRNIETDKIDIYVKIRSKPKGAYDLLLSGIDKIERYTEYDDFCDCSDELDVPDFKIFKKHLRRDNQYQLHWRGYSIDIVICTKKDLF